jgi:ABC-type multidrug transport system fused ATPase/permease subunit
MPAAARKLFALLSSREKGQLALLAAAMFCMAIVDVAGVASIMPFMTVVDNPEVIQSNRWLRLAYESLGYTKAESFMFSLGMLVLGLLLAGNLLKALTTWGSLRFDNQLNYKLARRLLAQYMSRPYTFFLNRNTADMGKNVLAEVRVVINGVLGAGTSALSSLLLCSLILALLLAIDPVIAVIIVSVLGGAYAGIYLLARRKLARISTEQVRANSMRFKLASEALSGIKDLKILRREGVFLERFAEQARRLAVNNVTLGIISQLPRYAMEVIAFGGILIILLHFLGRGEGSKQMNALLAVYAFAGYRLLPAVQQAFGSLTTIRANLHALDVLHRDLTERQGKTAADPVLSGSEDLEPLPFTRELEFRNVRFSYSGDRNYVLQGIDLSIARNSSVGVVGPTGSGKTTVVDLILGLLTPSSGELRIDGVELGPDNMVRWQRNLGYVPQGIFLCDDTIASNIALGVPEREIDMPAVVRAARIANIHEFIERDLPDGYDTRIGERGVRLSGGQRQRIGIARALYRDPAVLIMDEATSALDGITEEAVTEALRALSGKKTVVTIAHRLTTVKECDVIYLVEAGRIAARGTHDELLKSSAWFRAASRSGA